MKTVSDELFQLIKSLTKQEKRYFQIVRFKTRYWRKKQIRSTFRCH